MTEIFYSVSNPSCFYLCYQCYPWSVFFGRFELEYWRSTKNPQGSKTRLAAWEVVLPKIPRRVTLRLS
jgi:hypothetical protein